MQLLFLYFNVLKIQIIPFDVSRILNPVLQSLMSHGALGIIVNADLVLKKHLYYQC